MSKQFDSVASAYGSPMGRWTHPDIQPVPNSVRCYRVRLDAGGYDDGGAYWGIGKPLYCIEQPDHETLDSLGRLFYFRVFIRADSRLQAIDQAGIAKHMIKRPPVAEFMRLRHLEQKGTISAGCVMLRQRLQDIGFEG